MAQNLNTLIILFLCICIAIIQCTEDQGSQLIQAQDAQPPDHLDTQSSQDQDPDTQSTQHQDSPLAEDPNIELTQDEQSDLGADPELTQDQDLQPTEDPDTQSIQDLDDELIANPDSELSEEQDVQSIQDEDPTLTEQADSEVNEGTVHVPSDGTVRVSPDGLGNLEIHVHSPDPKPITFQLSDVSPQTIQVHIHSSEKADSFDVDGTKDADSVNPLDMNPLHTNPLDATQAGLEGSTNPLHPDFDCNNALEILRQSHNQLMEEKKILLQQINLYKQNIQPLIDQASQMENDLGATPVS